MRKKIILSVALIVALGASLVGFSAFEAHVINVTAKIENALSVTPDSIMFGTVFPQEHLHRNLAISLSESFLEEDRVDDIQYQIVQKLKPVPLDYQGPTEDLTGLKDENGADAQTEIIYYPSLCGYLSKHKVDVDEEQQEVEIDAFHNLRTWTGSHVMYDGIASGYLTKEGEDVADEWDIDLAVPCFKGMCAQDWKTWFTSINDNPELNPADYVLPADLEQATFGCDLWVEVTGVSTNYLDRVDFGNPVSESDHLDMIVDDWSYIGSQSCTGEECLKQGNYGGYDPSDSSHDFRGLMGAPTGCQATDPSHASATFTLDQGVGQEPKKLVLRHLDGSQMDSFDIYVNGEYVGHYLWQDSVENWVTTEWQIPTGLESILNIELIATDPDTQWCEVGWGQVMFNWAEIQEGLVAI